VTQNHWKSACEYILFFTNGDDYCRNWQGEHEMRNWMQHPICAGKERLLDAQGNTLHPTQKPEGVIAPLVAFSATVGDVVFDGFAGTGTTGAVAKAHGCKFVGIEQDARFFAAMERRLR
jgi:DNA modification methylase